jgi:hypothetical protein
MANGGSISWRGGRIARDSAYRQRSGKAALKKAAASPAKRRDDAERQRTWTIKLEK